MSIPNQDGSGSVAPVRSDKTLGVRIASDNRCTRSSAEKEYRTEEGGGRRAPRVGLCGGRNCKYTILEKFRARVTVGAPDACWPIAGCKANRSGHVQIATGSVAHPPHVRIRAHIFAWELANGRRVPPGLVVMHSCDNPRCCNPAHLNLGTQADNIHDAIHKGRFNAFGRQKLNALNVLEIRTMAAAGETQRSIAAKFGILRHSVSAIVNRRSWDHLGDRPFAPRAEGAEQGSNGVFERVPSVQLPILGEVR